MNFLFCFSRFCLTGGAGAKTGLNAAFVALLARGDYIMQISGSKKVILH